MPPKARTRSRASDVQPGREGKVQVKAWVDPDLRKRLKALAVDLDVPMESLLIQQIEALLKKHAK